MSALQEVDGGREEWRGTVSAAGPLPRCSCCRRTLNSYEVPMGTRLYPILCERCQDND